jgi:protein ImuA
MLSSSNIRTGRLAELRDTLVGLENPSIRATQQACLPLDLPSGHLPGPGLPCGVLHELTPAVHQDRPAALGFLFALAALSLEVHSGPAVFVASQRALAHFGQPYGHGLHQLGLDVDRLLLVITRTEKDALWALEETLRAQARPAVVAGAVESNLNLTSSRRLNLAAGVHSTSLLLLRPISGTSAARTRWRIGAAPAARDRFGTFAQARWRVALERSRNGRPGQWLVEWNHVAHRFRVVEGLADRPPLASTGFRLAG